MFVKVRNRVIEWRIKHYRTDGIRIHGCPDAKDYSTLVKAESRRLILDL